MFQHTAARRRLVGAAQECDLKVVFQHTAARRRLAAANDAKVIINIVSTHSRPKAAGVQAGFYGQCRYVSTHSRPKAAGRHLAHTCQQNEVSTHSRPKAAGGRLKYGGFF